MSPSTPPRYVDYGGMQAYPAPSRFTDVAAHGFLLEAARERTQAFVDLLLNAPAHGAVEYRTFASHVMLTFVDTGVGRFSAFPNIGYGSEREVVFWVPVARVKREAGVAIVEQLAWFVPYIFVDNPIAMVSGREVYGFLKEWGWISLPTATDPGAPFWCDTLAAKQFSPDTHIQRLRLLEMTAVDPGAPRKVRTEWETIAEAVEAIRHAMGAGDAITLPGLELAKEVLDLLVHGEMPLVFLKQLRDVAGDGACYQAIVEANARLESFRGFELDNAVDFVLQTLDSHPIAEDIGAQSQRATLCFDAEIAFTMEAGRVVWQAGS